MYLWCIPTMDASFLAANVRLKDMQYYAIVVTIFHFCVRMTQLLNPGSERCQDSHRRPTPAGSADRAAELCIRSTEGGPRPGEPLVDLVTGEELARVLSPGVARKAALDFARLNGGPALRALLTETFAREESCGHSRNSKDHLGPGDPAVRAV
jgi:hypothetical protein